MAVHGEERIASLIAAAGVIWAVKVTTSSMLPAYATLITTGPMEICALGILMWLHAKWRRTVEAQQAHEEAAYRLRHLLVTEDY
jgi:hypothetical protein